MTKFLVLKAPPVGLGSLMVTTICGKLYAELTGRIPIVLWRQNCLYHESTDSAATIDNAFEYFFEPLSGSTIADLIGKQYSYYPACWNDQNILNDTLMQQDDQAHFRLPIEVDCSGSDADVLVVTEYSGITSYLPGLMAAYPHFQGLSELEMLSRYFYNQIHLNSRMQRLIADFKQQHLKAQINVGLRIRRTDFAALKATPSDSMYVNAVNAYTAKLDRSYQIFLATDCARTLKKFRQIYGDRLVYTDCIRSENACAIHLSRGNNRIKGEQMLLDLHVLASCDYFIGSDSNWFWLITRILNEPLISQDKVLYLSATRLQKLQKAVSVSSTTLLKTMYRRSKMATKELLNLA